MLDENKRTRQMFRDIKLASMRSSNAETFTVLVCYDHHLNTDCKRRLFNFGKCTAVLKKGFLSGLFSVAFKNGDQNYDVGPLCSINTFKED